MLTSILAVALAAAPAAASPTYAAPGFNGINVDKKLVEFYSEHFAQKLQEGGLAVKTATDLSLVVELERRKEILGCADTSTDCVIELASALGVDRLVVGRIAKLDKIYQVNVKVLTATDARTLVAFSARANNDAELLGRLDEAAAHVLGRLGVEAPPGVSSSGTSAVSGRQWPIWPSVGAVVLLAAGGGLTWMSTEEVKKMETAEGLDELHQHQRNANLQRGVGLPLLVGGVAAAAATTWLFLRSGPEEPSLTAEPMAGPSGAGVLFRGRFE